MDWPQHSTPGATRSGWIVSIVVLAIPGMVLGLAAFQYQSMLLAIGTVSAVLGACLFARCPQVWRPPVSACVIGLYVIALGWLWVATRVEADAFARACRGLLILMTLAMFIVHDLIRTGVEPRRIARKISQRISSRSRWPNQISEIEHLPDVVRLKMAVRDDPTLILHLLSDRRIEVQAAALFALQDRSHWRWDEGSVVLGVARKAYSPEVRALAASALAASDHADLISGMCELLKDPNPDVRNATLRALLNGGETRWASVRLHIRATLCDPAMAKDGALPLNEIHLPPVAICDLTGWATETPPLAERSVQSLLKHYHARLKNQDDPSLASELGGQITEEQTPAVLRVELAHLLQKHGALTQELLDRMTDPDQPSAIRLLAVTILLEGDPTDAAALDVLRGLGRQTNRDTAVAIARILQKHLGMEFGVPAPGVPLAIKQTAEITQRVQRWALTKTSSSTWDEDGLPLLGPPDGDEASIMFGLSGSTSGPASVPGINSFRQKR